MGKTVKDRDREIRAINKAMANLDNGRYQIVQIEELEDTRGVIYDIIDTLKKHKEELELQNIREIYSLPID
jgi:hypothetical protein